MSADRKILCIAGCLCCGVCAATAITSDIGPLRVMAGLGLMYSLGVLLIGITGVREDRR